MSELGQVVLHARRDHAPRGIQTFMYFVYIIKSTIKSWYYVGSTDNVERRLCEHNSGKTKSTKPYIPFEIVYTETFNNKTEARVRENLIKRNHALKKSLVSELK